MRNLKSEDVVEAFFAILVLGEGYFLAFVVCQALFKSAVAAHLVAIGIVAVAVVANLLMEYSLHKQRQYRPR